MNKYERQYDIKEVIEFPTGTEFIKCYGGKSRQVKVGIGGELLYLNNDNVYKNCTLNRTYLNAKYMLVRKEIPFMEAIEEKLKGKCIACYLNGKLSSTILPSNDYMTNECERPISIDEVTKGSWYVID